MPGGVSLTAGTPSDRSPTSRRCSGFAATRKLAAPSTLPKALPAGREGSQEAEAVGVRRGSRAGVDAHQAAARWTPTGSTTPGSSAPSWTGQPTPGGAVALLGVDGEQGRHRGPAAGAVDGGGVGQVPGGIASDLPAGGDPADRGVGQRQYPSHQGALRDFCNRSSDDRRSTFHPPPGSIRPEPGAIWPSCSSTMGVGGRREDKLPRNVARNVKTTTRQPRHFRPLTAAEARQFLDSARADRLAGLVLRGPAPGAAGGVPAGARMRCTNSRSVPASLGRPRPHNRNGQHPPLAPAHPHRRPHPPTHQGPGIRTPHRPPCRMPPLAQGAQGTTERGTRNGRAGLERQRPRLHHAHRTASRPGQPHPPLP